MFFPNLIVFMAIFLANCDKEHKKPINREIELFGYLREVVCFPILGYFNCLAHDYL